MGYGEYIKNKTKKKQINKSVYHSYEMRLWIGILVKLLLLKSKNVNLTIINDQKYTTPGKVLQLLYVSKGSLRFAA